MMLIDCLRKSLMLRLTLAAGFCLSVSLGDSSAEAPKRSDQSVTGRQNVDGLLIVDCLLPGQVRRLGAAMTYLTPRQALKLNADECAIRGGEYVAYDRADLNTALSVWLPQALAGDAQAQTYVGELYERGIADTAPRYRDAAEWYTKAAAQGNARARINLGFLYEKGLGVDKDQVAALNLYRQASGLEGAIALDGDAPVNSSAQNEALRLLRKELEQTRLELDKAREELNRRQGDKRSEIDRLERERSQARAQGNGEAEGRFAEQLQQRERTLDAQRSVVAQLERKVAEYRDRLEGTDTERGALAARLAETERKLKDTAKELSARRALATTDEQQLALLRDELVQSRAESTTSAKALARMQGLQQQLELREAQLARQAADIARIESEAKTYQERLAHLEASPAPAGRAAPAASAADQNVAIAAPSIQLIDPPAMSMRSPLAIKVRGALKSRAIVGKVTAPAGLLSFSVNEQSETTDASGLFKAEVPMRPDATPVSLVAIDRRGNRAAFEFTLVPEGVMAAPEGRVPSIPTIEFGNYHALVIGNQAYQHLPRLDTAVADANAVSELLRKKYGFKVTTLINANRYEILSALNDFRARLTEGDNLLIYYGGHGEIDRANQRGHWLPVDAEPNSDANWISSVAISDILNAMSAKHVLVVADSCYSGAMTRSSIGNLESGLSEEARATWLKALVKARARTALTSGGVQPVMDGGGGEHSVFAKAFLDVLRENDGALETQRVYREVAARVVFAAQRFKVEQRPEYAPLKFAGHESGDFIFVPSGT